MIVINFAHPLTLSHLKRLEVLAGQPMSNVINVDSQINPLQPLAPQISKLIDTVAFSPLEWQTLPLIINPPSLNYAATLLITELHGRCGYFPSIMRLRPKPSSCIPEFEVAEIINNQHLREIARNKRMCNRESKN